MRDETGGGEKKIDLDLKLVPPHNNNNKNKNNSHHS